MCLDQCKTMVFIQFSVGTADKDIQINVKQAARQLATKSTCVSSGNFLRSIAQRPVIVNRWEYEILPGWRNLSHHLGLQSRKVKRAQTQNNGKKFYSECQSLKMHPYHHHSINSIMIMTIRRDSDESVGYGDLVKVRVLPVEEVGVRPPDAR